jgi:hypothetical protein
MAIDKMNKRAQKRMSYSQIRLDLQFTPFFLFFSRSSASTTQSSGNQTEKMAAAAVLINSTDIATPYIQTQLYTNGFLEIKFNRPQKYNCVDVDMLMIMSEIFTKYVDGPDGLLCKGILFCAVLGKAFCSGADIKAMAACSPRQKVIIHS